MHRILIIDDDERLAVPLADFFARHQMQLESATHLEQGLEMLEQGQYKLVILDVMLPDRDGFELCRIIRARSSIPIVMLSARGEVSDRLVGLELGADDYVTKPFEPRELVFRIHNILKRSDPDIANKPLVFLDMVIQPSSQRVEVAGEARLLTSKEYQLLLMLASSPGKSFSRDNIASVLRGTEVDLFSRAVDIQISRLRQKLKPTDYIKTIWGAGYQFSAPSANTDGSDNSA